MNSNLEITYAIPRKFSCPYTNYFGDGYGFGYGYYFGGGENNDGFGNGHGGGHKLGTEHYDYGAYSFSPFYEIISCSRSFRRNL